jgi:hypothetical protein
MASFSIWHWAIIFALIAVIVISILAANQRKQLARKEYITRSVGVGAAMMIASVVNQELFELIGLIGGVLFILWSVHRTQHIGWSRWWNLLHAIPFVGLVWWIILMATPKRTTPQ